MGRGKGGKGKGGGGGSWDGGGGEGGGGGGGNKPFWRQFVDPSDDPEIIAWCRHRVQQFLDTGKQQEEVEWMGNDYRNTVRSLAPDMGAAWVKIDKGVYAFVRSSANGMDPSAIRMKVVAAIRKICEESGGRCSATGAWRQLPQDFQATVSVELRLRNLRGLPEVCQAELQESGIRMNDRRNMFILGESDGYDDAVFVKFSASLVGDARRALDTALRLLPKPKSARWRHDGTDFIHKFGTTCMGPDDLERERALPGFQRMLPMRARLPAFVMDQEICATVRRERVTLILGATGCGKTTQIPQMLLEDLASRGETCRILASQPRRISAYSVAERVAMERGGKLGDTVAYKIRFEDKVTPTTQVVFCTVGILLRVMQSNTDLEGATHIIVDEVHERDLHTDFLLTLLRRVLNKRSDLKLILMSATVDPSAFQSYFPDATTLSIPGKTNYPIDEFFIEDILRALPGPARARWQGASGAKRSKPSAFSQGPLPVPLEAHAVHDALPSLPWDLAGDVARVHASPPEDIDFDLVQLVIEMIHGEGQEGGILVFMPGWFEIAEMMKRLARFNDLHVHALHSRMPTAEQQTIFQPPPRGKRKVIVATILAETSITIEDIVYVIDTGRARSTFFNEISKVSALRTVWYSKANGFQRRGRSGRCRPGRWYRLFSSLQWDAMDEYSLPEMLRSPLEELCLEVASLDLGPPSIFLADAISPPPEAVVYHAVNLLYNLGAVSDATGAKLTPLGEKLTRLQVHPMLGKMLLLAGLFRCFQPMMTICASLGYKSPFLCPLGKEKEANAAKRNLAAGSQSDLMALANAYVGWCARKASFANENFLSHQTMDYIHRLRQDLQGVARDLLANVPADHSDPQRVADVCRAVVTAGLYPNLAWIRRFGKGSTLAGLKVCVHPGSVNAKESDSVVAFYDIQETSDRWLYDTTVVSMAPCLLFAPSLEELHRGKRVVFRVGDWLLAVDPQVADDLVALRASLLDFVSRSVGHAPTDVHMSATDALCKLFSERVVLEAADEEEDEEAAGQSAADDVSTAPAFAAGEAVECYWPDGDEYLPATVVAVQAGEGTNGASVGVAWAEDGSRSDVPNDYVRRAKRAASAATTQEAASRRAKGQRRGGGGRGYSGGGGQRGGGW